MQRVYFIIFITLLFSQPSSAEDNKSLQYVEDEIAKLEAQIAKEQDTYNKRPKIKYFGIKVTEERFKQYVHDWRQKVLKIGNANYPLEAIDKKIYGAVRVTVSINADGTLDKIHIDKSSGKKIIDNHVVASIKEAMPFRAFDEAIKKDTDQLGITSTFEFTRATQ